MIKAKLHLTILAAAVLLPWAGCTKSDFSKTASDRLVGTWIESPEASGDPKGSGETEDLIQFEFKADGTMAVKLPIFSPAKGTWQVVQAEGDSLTVKTVIDVRSVSTSSHTDAKGRDVEKEVVKTKKEERDLTVLFQGDDRIEIGPKEQPNERIALDRKR